MCWAVLPRVSGGEFLQQQHPLSSCRTVLPSLHAQFRDCGLAHPTYSLCSLSRHSQAPTQMTLDLRALHQRTLTSMWVHAWKSKKGHRASRHLSKQHRSWNKPYLQGHRLRHWGGGLNYQSSSVSDSKQLSGWKSDQTDEHVTPSNLPRVQHPHG